MNQESSTNGESLRGASTTDWLLERFVHLANQGSGTADITIQVQGTVLTGTLIGVFEYMKEFAKYGQIDGDDDSNNDTHRNDIDTWFELSEQYLSDARSSDPADEGFVPPTYIHLRNAKIVTGVTMIPTHGELLWRGRISEVGGFSIGRLV